MRNIQIKTPKIRILISYILKLDLKLIETSYKMASDF